MNWHEYFLNLTRAVSVKSKDSTKSGCIIVASDNSVRATGFNGLPRGVDDDVPERKERPEKYVWTEHAERNAIFQAAKTGAILDGCTIYINWRPCAECSRAIIQCGIKKVVIDGSNVDAIRDARWEESFKVSEKMFKEAKIEFIIYNQMKEK